jgi:antirestriction protein ArdC
MPSVYEIITEKIIKQLESGEAPWRKPWTCQTPANLLTQKEYRMRQRNAPSAREANVMKWGNERKTDAWESSAAAELCRSGATGRRI